MEVIKVAGSSRIRAVWLSHTNCFIHLMFADFTLMRALSEMNLSWESASFLITQLYKLAYDRFVILLSFQSSTLLDIKFHHPGTFHEVMKGVFSDNGNTDGNSYTFFFHYDRDNNRKTYPLVFLNSPSGSELLLSCLRVVWELSLSYLQVVLVLS